MKLLFTLLLTLVLVKACSPEMGKSEVAITTNSTRDIVMLTELKDDEEAIKKYEYYHSAKGVWPEVINAAKVSGIESIKIYRFANVLVMILTVPGNIDMNEVNRKYAASSERIKEWSQLMSTFQQAPAQSKDGSIWVPMKLIHDYCNGIVK